MSQYFINPTHSNRKCDAVLLVHAVCNKRDIVCIVSYSSKVLNLLSVIAVWDILEWKERCLLLVKTSKEIMTLICMEFFVYFICLFLGFTTTGQCNIIGLVFTIIKLNIQESVLTSRLSDCLWICYGHRYVWVYNCRGVQNFLLWMRLCKEISEL